MARWSVKDCTVEIEDSSAGYNMVVGPGEGTFTVDGLEEDNSEAIAKYDRGTFDGFMEGPDVQQTFSIELELEIQTLTHASQDRIKDAVCGTGLWAWTPTSGPTSCDPANQKWAPKIRVTWSRGAVTTTLTLPCCRVKGGISEDAAGLKFSLSGTNYVVPTWT